MSDEGLDEALEEEGSSDEASADTQMRQNGVPIHAAERCAIPYDKRHLRISDDYFLTQSKQQQQQQQQQHRRLANLWLSKPAFVVRSLREVLEPGELNTAWRSGKEGSFSCYNRNVFVGVRRLQRGSVITQTEDVKFYSSGDGERAARGDSGGGGADDHLPPFSGYDGYFSKEDFEELHVGEPAPGSRTSAAVTGRSGGPAEGSQGARQKKSSGGGGGGSGRGGRVDRSGRQGGSRGDHR